MSIETKRYRLLKDLYSNSNDLIIPKDSVFEFKPEYNGYMCLGITAILSKETVEGKLSHFELIPEQSNDKGSGRVEVSDIMEANTNVGRRTYAGYAFTSSKLIPPDKFPLIKLLIERFLNDEYRIHIDGTWSIHSHGERTFIQSEVDTIREDLWNRCREWADGQWSNQFFPDGKNSQFKYPTLQDYINKNKIPKSSKPMEKDAEGHCLKHPNKVGKDKDWEIVSYSYRNRIYKKNNLGDYSASFDSPIHELILHPENMTKIYSVKRLSDGTVFSIGDYVGITKESGKSIKGWKDIIESFLIVDDTMVSVFKTFRQPINDLDKLTPTEETDKAVTNNDDVACLSLNDLLDVWDDDLERNKRRTVKKSFMETQMYKRFEQKVKEKLKSIH